MIEAEVFRIPHRIPGVYILHEFVESRGSYPALYVGKSEDLRGRLLQHLRTRSTSEDILSIRSLANLRFSAAPVLLATARGRIEAGLIRVLRPVCNRQVPAVAPIFVNLPPMMIHDGIV